MTTRHLCVDGITAMHSTKRQNRRRRPSLRSFLHCAARHLQGYVYSELAKITHSDIAASEKMAEWLAEKLKKPEPSIKWKVNRCAAPELSTASMATQSTPA